MFMSTHNDCHAVVSRHAKGFPADGEKWYGLVVTYA